MRLLFMIDGSSIDPIGSTVRVVIEGLPGAGKTELAKQLAASLKLPLIPEFVVFEGDLWKQFELKKPFYRANDELKESVASYLEEPLVIFDRHYPGTLAFAHALDATPGIEPPDAENYESELQWYRQCLRDHRLSTPDCVLILDIDPLTSLRRQPRAKAFDPAFGNVEFLNALRTYYRSFYATIESNVQMHWIDASDATSSIYMRARDIIGAAAGKKSNVSES